jgi:hypothetical protein
VVGAVAFAGLKAPLACALLRLFVGDNKAAKDIVQLLANMAVGKAYRLRREIGRVEAEDMARAVLAWHRDGTCHVCDGIGVMKMEGVPVLSGHKCAACHGTGKRPFEQDFSSKRIELAKWLVAEVQREQAIAGPLAMNYLARHVEL